MVDVKLTGRKLGRAPLLASVIALWCWLLTAAHGIWSMGIVAGYLDGGPIPVTPLLPVTYISFFVHSFNALSITFLIAFSLCLIVPRHYHVGCLCMAWAIGGAIGLSGLAFAYQIDFGTTFTPFEATRALILRPIVTPIWLFLGMAGTALFMRRRQVRAQSLC